MKTIGAVEQRIIEDAAARIGIPTLLLMEQAARAVADRALALLPYLPCQRVTILCGGGNNGGDGYAAARMLLDHVPELRLFEVEAIARNQGDARLNREACLGLGLVPEPLDHFQPSGGVIVDALFGSGYKADRLPSAEFIDVVEKIAISRSEHAARVLAVDLPSGVESETGRVGQAVVCADETLTFVLPKTGMYSYPGRKYCGTIRVCDLGVPPSLIEQVWETEGFRTPRVVDVQEVRGWKPAVQTDSHKGSFGRAALLAGSPGMAGAAILAGRAALKAGCGYVYITVPESIYPAVLEAAPSLLTTIVPDWGKSDLPEGFGQTFLEGKDAVLIGPGMGSEAQRSRALQRLLNEVIGEAKRLVLDADALNLMAGADCLANYRERLQARTAAGLEPAILTPHPGEFARLCPEGADLVLQDRIRAARMLAELTGSVIVLKGAGTVVVFPDGGDPPETWINASGNVGMAKAGSGDVLSGLLAALLAQGLPLRQAVLAGVYLHGLAGDVMAQELTSRALTPEDTLAGLPAAYRQVGWED